jgi:hypothetical protein
MKKLMAILFFSFLVFGIVLHSPLVVSDGNDSNSGGDSGNSITNNSGSSDDEEDSNSSNNDSENDDLNDGETGRACEEISGERFRSIDKYEVGLGIGEDGTARGYWWISFGNGKFSWSYSDVVEEGSYICKGNLITGTSITGRKLAGGYDINKNILIWDGKKYANKDQTEIEVQHDGKIRKIKIHEGEDGEKIREAIKERNRLRFGFNNSELPENCEKHGSAIKCDMGGKLETNIRISVEGVNLSEEVKQTIEDLRTSFENTTGEVKIRIGVVNNKEAKIETEGTITDSQQEIIDLLVSQITALVANTENEAKIKIDLQRKFSKAREMIVFAGRSGNIIIQIKGINMTTNVELYQNNGSVYAILGNNETLLISYLPDEIREKIRERIHSKIEGNESIEFNNDGQYQVNLEKRARFLGIFKVKEKMRFHVDPETGDILNENAPWWGFLARDEGDNSTGTERETNSSNTTAR